MSSEYGKERSAGVPYEPWGDERRQASESIYQAVRDTIGMDAIIRFSRFAGRYKIPIPRDEDLLRHVTFDHMGSGMGFIHLRALVDLPCSPPGEGIFHQDPYVQTVDVYISKPESIRPSVDGWGDGPPPLLRRNNEPVRQNTREKILLAVSSAAFLAAAFCVTTHCANTNRSVREAMNEPVEKKKEEPRDERPVIPQMRPR